MQHNISFKTYFSFRYLALMAMVIFSVNAHGIQDSCFDFDEEYVGECCQKYMGRGDTSTARGFCADACRGGHKDSCFQYAHILSSSNAEVAQKIYSKLCNESYDKACEFKGPENLERTDDASIVINSQSNDNKNLSDTVALRRAKNMSPAPHSNLIKKERPRANKKVENRKIDESLIGRKNQEQAVPKIQESGYGTLLIFLFAILLVGILLAIFREKKNKMGQELWPNYDHDQAVEELMVKKEASRPSEDMISRSEFEKFKGRVLDLVFQHDINKIKNPEEAKKEEKTVIVDLESPPPLTLIKNEKKSSDFLYDK
jgi:hypothetical protein